MAETSEPTLSPGSEEEAQHATATVPGGTPGTKNYNIQTQGTQLLPLIITYFKTAGLLFAVWLLGYFNFSATWVLVGLFFFVVNEQYRKSKEAKIKFAQDASKNERQAILARTDELPSWVYFPDVERAEWLNKIIKQMWPYIGEYVKDMMKNTVEPQVQQSMPKSLQPFKFERIDLGDIPPRVGGIKVYTEHLKRDELIMDMEIFYASDSHIKVAVRGLNSGIKDLTIHGTVRIVMKPLVNVVPIIGGMTVFFLNPPSVDFDLTDAANLLDMPLLSSSLRTVVEDQIAYYMVLPNKIPIKLVENIDLSLLKYPIPQGVLRLHIVAARDLKRADMKLIGKGKSDPYVKLYVGAQAYKTKVIQNTINPVWDQYFEAVVEQRHGQVVDLEVLDEDPGDDDELGVSTIDIESVAKAGSIDTWLPLENVKTGMVHVRGLWLHLSKDADDLEREVETMGTYKEGKKAGSEELLSSALLLVTLEGAKSLPRSKKSMSEPSPYAKLSIGNTTKKSMPKAKTADPKWEENFQYLIHDPYHQDLEVEILDSAKNDKNLGRVTISLKSMLAAKDLTVNRPFTLRESGPESKVNLRICMRVLTSELPADWALDEGTSSDPEPQPLSPAEPRIEEAVLEKSSASGVEAEPQPPEPAGQVEDLPTEGVAGKPTQDANDQAVADRPGQKIRYRGNTATTTSTSSEGGEYGSIQLTARHVPQRNSLTVVIHKCRNLIPCDDDNVADPYVKMYMLPEKSSSSKRKTKVIKNDLNPVFDETFDWSLSLAEAQSHTLEVSVKNSTGVFSRERERIGKVEVPLGQLDLVSGDTRWFDLEDPEGEDSDEE